MTRLTFQATVIRLARLAAARGGTVAAVDVELDELLAGDRGTTSAAARMLASGTDVASTPETEPGAVRAHRSNCPFSPRGQAGKNRPTPRTASVNGLCSAFLSVSA